MTHSCRPTRRSFLAGTLAAVVLPGCGVDKPPEVEESTALSAHPTTVSGAKLHLPLLTQLYDVDSFIRHNMELPYDPGLGSVGLILYDTLKPEGYWCSPRNGRAFARTGGDGDHYSLLIRNGAIDETSPVVLTMPASGEQFVVGESLYDSLCFGLHGGFFAVLSGNEEPTIEVDGHWFNSHVKKFAQDVLFLMMRELSLKPWPRETRQERFAELQKRFLPMVQVPGYSLIRSRLGAGSRRRCGT